MNLPFFYTSEYDKASNEMVLNEESSRHVVQVLRMKKGELLNLTDGQGHLLTCEIAADHKKHCAVIVKEVQFKEAPVRKISIAISLIKNASRFEWFLEKATEIGVTGIIPLICERTEKERFRFDRMQGIVTSAMLQSQQCWLPVLQEPVLFENLVKTGTGNGIKFIAHCMEGSKQELSEQAVHPASQTLICIGPEGDFTANEIELALQNQFLPVSLGTTRLRTETAGIVAACLLKAAR